MHDPFTLLFKIPGIVILWHRDPECRGDDDSCDWFGTTQSAERIAWLRAEGESCYAEFFGNAEDWHGALRNASTLEVVHAIWRVIDWRYERAYTQRFAGWRSKRRVTRDIPHIFDLACGGWDNLGYAVRAAQAGGPAESAELFHLVGRHMQRVRRPWYRHPRWHVWHWRVTPVLAQRVWRYLTQRCAACGTRFAWNGGGCVRTTDGLRHMDCLSESPR